MRRIVITFFSLLMLTLMAGVASAQNPHFIKTDAGFSGTSPNIAVSFKEAGLGDNLLVNISVSAQASAVYACINGGGNGTLAEVSERAQRFIESRKIRAALLAHGGNKTRAAETLGVSYKTLLTKIKDYDL